MRGNTCLLIVLFSSLILLPAACNFGNLENLQGEIVIENNSQYQVVEFYVALEASENWGENLLDSPIESGGTRTVAGLPREDIKVKTVFFDGSDNFENINHDPNLLLSSRVTLKLSL